MPNKSSSSHPLLLSGALLFGLLALFLGLVGLTTGGGYRLDSDLSTDGLSQFSQLIFNAAALLGLQPFNDVEPNVWFSAARLFAVLFAGFAVVGIVLELYRPASDSLLRFRFWWNRVFSGGKPITIIGLGWIGGHLARTLRGEGRPVYGIEWEEDSSPAIEARRNGALVVTGDATDPDVRHRAGLEHASEVFIATGDDTRNLEIAGGLLQDEEEERIWTGRTEDPVTCYIHIGDPTLSSTLRAQELLKNRSAKVTFRTFCNRTLAANDLFFDLFLDQDRGFLSAIKTTGYTEESKTSDPETAVVMPESDDEIFHLFVFGFGLPAQAIALHTARFAHFSTLDRPRITVFGDTRDGKAPWNEFLDRHPAFSPPDLDLTDDSFLKAGDAWTDRPGHPAFEEYCTSTLSAENEESEVREQRSEAIEYAVNAEYHPLLRGAEPGKLLDAIEARLTQTAPRPKVAFVMCLDEERQSFEAALRLQQDLARRFLQDPSEAESDVTASSREATELPPGLEDPAPIFVYLPVEEGLAELLTKQSGNGNRENIDDLRMAVDRRLPLYAFGERRDINSPGAITQGSSRTLAETIRGVHAALSPHGDTDHPDFDDSNLDAILFAEMKFDALDISFLTERQAQSEEIDERPLLTDLFEGRVDEEMRDLRKAATTANDGRLWITTEKLKSLSQPLRERISLMDLIYVPPEGTQDWEARNEDAWKALKAVRNDAIEESISRFERELATANGRSPELAAKMEHNRWMGERLSKGWKFGPRSDVQKQRSTFVPWDHLSDSDRLYDRQQVPRLILAQRRRGYFAFASFPSEKNHDEEQRTDRQVSSDVTPTPIASSEQT